MSRFHVGNTKWAKIRKQVLDAENWKCRLCGTYANEVDHIEPIYKGGSEYETENLQAICRGCHIQKTKQERNVSRSIEGSQEWDLVLQHLI